MADAVQACAFLVVRTDNMPGGMICIRRIQHLVPGPGILVPAFIGRYIHGTEFPELSRVAHTPLEAAGLLFHTHVEPVLDQCYSSFDAIALKGRAVLQKAFVLFLCAEAHDRFHTCAVIPAAIEDHHFAGSREMSKIPLHVHLGLFPFAGCRQRHYLESSRAYPFGNAFDNTALAGCVPTLEYDDYTLPRFFYPVLQLDQLPLQFFQFGLVCFCRQLPTLRLFLFARLFFLRSDFLLFFPMYQLLLLEVLFAALSGPQATLMRTTVMTSNSNPPTVSLSA